MDATTRAASNAVIDTERGTRRLAREQRQASSSGGRPGNRGIFDPKLLRSAIPEAIRKLDPRLLIRNPVIFWSS